MLSIAYVKVEELFSNHTRAVFLMGFFSLAYKMLSKTC